MQLYWPFHCSNIHRDHQSVWSLCFLTDDKSVVLFSNQVLTFKEINWQSLRIEADAIERDDQDLGSTPLRLITNQGRIRIALKRRVRLPFRPLIYSAAVLSVLIGCHISSSSHFVLSRSKTVTCLRPNFSSSWTTSCGFWQTRSSRPSSIMPNLWVKPWKSQPSSGRAELLNPFRLLICCACRLFRKIISELVKYIF